MVRVIRLTSTEIDEAIVDMAAGLFARHGMAQTSVQAIADATGYSKAGLLARFSTKQSLRDAVIRRCEEVAAGVSASASVLPRGAKRDHSAITSLVDQAQSSSGVATLMLSVIGPQRDPETADALQPVRITLFEAFGFDPDDTPRLTRIGAAIGVVLVTTLGLDEAHPRSAEMRNEIIDAACNAMGHPFGRSSIKRKKRDQHG